MTVPVKAILLEPVEVKSPLNLTTVVPAAIGGTCLVLLCAVVSFAIHRRNRSKKEIEKLKSALDRRDEKTPEVDPSVIQLAQQFAAQEREDEKVSDQFQPADDVSALELSEHMAKKGGDSHDHVIDPSVLSLAQQLAESESPRISPTGGQVDPASLYPISSTQPSALSDAGLSQVICYLYSTCLMSKVPVSVPFADLAFLTGRNGIIACRTSRGRKNPNGGSSSPGSKLCVVCLWTGQITTPVENVEKETQRIVQRGRDRAVCDYRRSTLINLSILCSLEYQIAADKGVWLVFARQEPHCPQRNGRERLLPPDKASWRQRRRDSRLMHLGCLLRTQSRQWRLTRKRVL
jgi:hypothetical protein